MNLQQLLDRTAALHQHLCPRQVLGVRMGLLAGSLLDIAVPQDGKRLLTIVETDGCGSDGVAVATNCWVGRRTMRVVDYGKMAATFVDCDSDRAIRIRPAATAREASRCTVAGADHRWEAMLLAYQRLPDDQLLEWQAVQLDPPVAELISRPGLRVNCAACGEEVMNEREVVVGPRRLCRACAHGAYYDPKPPDAGDV